MSLRLLVLPSSATFPVTALASGTISHDACTVTVNECGVLTSGPSRGLRTLDGPEVSLQDRFAEWFGVSFSDASGPVLAMGAGNAPDWGGRPRVDPVTFEATPESVIAVTRVRDLLVTTTFRFDAIGPYLLVAVEFTNLGSDFVTNFFYSREWHQPGDAGWTYPSDYSGLAPSPPPGLCRRVWMLDDIA